MVVEQRITLKSTQDELKIIEAENAAMKERLVTSETKVGALERVNEAQEEKLANVKAENAAQQAELAVVKTRLSASEAEVVNMKMETAALSADLRSVADRLASTETDMEQLKMENAAQEAVLTAVKTRLVAVETEVEDLEKAIRAAPKVAFSAALNEGYTEAGATSLNVVFGRVITNFGQAYSSVSGFFTAPLVLGLSEHDSDGYFSYLSSGVTLELEVGDVINLVLPAGKRLYDDGWKYSTFSGFLLFPL
ncbi:uncharacterized protein LOC134440693 [Engraulis encrasicolus]|uniref:uncharacterized protein LOC134440693 n=1 Tax=Engraulis encrasicolus TaxID=184585 RepID=UPI002FD2427D